MTTTQEKLATVKEACGKALSYEDPVFIQDINYTLANVLLAYTKSVPKWNERNLQSIVFRWKWHSDDLAAQSAVTIDFLYDLLT